MLVAMDPRTDCDDLRLARAIRFITQDLTRRPTLAAIARVASLERTYFCKCFQKAFGMTFSEWNSRVRVEESQRLLCTTRLPITAIASAVGYGDVTTFERNFRRVTSLTPRQYRRLQKHIATTQHSPKDAQRTPRLPVDAAITIPPD
jgi:AraC-like DNA-binding protein